MSHSLRSLTIKERIALFLCESHNHYFPHKKEQFTQQIWIKSYFLYLFKVFCKLKETERFALFLFFKERCEWKWAIVSNLLRLHTKNEWLWANGSGHSLKMSKWANHFFFANCSFAHFFWKKLAVCSEKQWANSQPSLKYEIGVLNNCAQSIECPILLTQNSLPPNWKGFLDYIKDMIERMGCDVWAYDPSHGAPATRYQIKRAGRLQGQEIAQSLNALSLKITYFKKGTLNNLLMLFFTKEQSAFVSIKK